MRPTTEEQLAAVRAVRDLLDGGRLWLQRATMDAHGRRCLIAAAVDATGGSAALVEAIGDVIADHRPDITGPELRRTVRIVAFNDHPSTTWADVEAVLDKAEARLEEAVEP